MKRSNKPESPGESPGNKRARELGQRKNFSDRKQSPKAIAQLLESAFGSYRIKEKLNEYSAFPFWEEIVGKDIAAVAIPEKIVRGKVLKIRVLDAVWAQELSLMKTKILDDIHKFGTGAVIEDLSFTIGNPKSFKPS